MTILQSDVVTALSAQELNLIDRYWRAANYLSVGQIYLLDNPLLRQPLLPNHVKPRLLGHWGTTPGLNFIYAHLNRVIRSGDLDMIYVCGPGHAGPGMVANAYLEGTYCEIYPSISQDEEGMRKLFRQFSFPGGIPSHAAPETPGSTAAALSPVANPARVRRSTSTPFAYRARWQRSPIRWVGLMASSSPPVSASINPRCARRSAITWRGLAS
jgi:hypothetical protein